MRSGSGRPVQAPARSGAARPVRRCARRAARRAAAGIRQRGGGGRGSDRRSRGSSALAAGVAARRGDDRPRSSPRHRDRGAAARRDRGDLSRAGSARGCGRRWMGDRDRAAARARCPSIRFADNVDTLDTAAQRRGAAVGLGSAALEHRRAGGSRPARRRACPSGRAARSAARWRSPRCCKTQGVACRSRRRAPGRHSRCPPPARAANNDPRASRSRRSTPPRS